MRIVYVSLPGIAIRKHVQHSCGKILANFEYSVRPNTTGATPPCILGIHLFMDEVFAGTFPANNTLFAGTF